MSKLTARHGSSASRRQQRHGASIVELALILPLLMLTVIGLCTAQVGVFRYHQIAAIAQESARWASVHGNEYARQNNTSVADVTTVSENVIKARAVGLNLEKLNVEVKWNEEHTLVTVQITYEWIPAAFFPSQSINCTAFALSAY